MEQARLNPVSSQGFEREMTAVFLEFQEELVQKRMEEYSAALPPQPEVKPVDCVLPRREPDKVSLPAAKQEPLKTEPLKTKPLSKVVMLGVPPPVAERTLMLPAKRPVAFCEVRLPEKREPLSLRYPSKFQVPRPSGQKSLESLELDKPGEIALRPVRLPEKAEPFQMWYLLVVAVPQKAAMRQVPPLMLPGERKVGLRAPVLPDAAGQVKVGLPEAVAVIPAANASRKRCVLERVSAMEKDRVQTPSPKQMKRLEQLRVDLPENTRTWFHQDPPVLPEKSHPVTANELEKTVVPELSFDLLKLWDEMDGLAAMIADFGRSLPKAGVLNST